MCGTPQVKVIAFRSKPRTLCLDPLCPTNHEPEISIGECKACAEAGKKGDLTVRRSMRPGSRVVTSCSSQPLPSGSLNSAKEP